MNQPLQSYGEEFKLKEHEQVMETYREQIGMAMQIVSGLIVVNATVLGFAVSLEVAGLFLIGALISGVILLVIESGERSSRSVLLRGIQLELEFGQPSSIGSVWAAKFYGEKYLREAQNVLVAEEESQKLEKLLAFSSVSPSKKSTVRYMLIAALAVVGQILLAILLPVIQNWRLV